MDTLKFPLRFTADGEIKKLREGTDDYYKQMLSVCILTEPFILPLTPDFGTADPTFSSLPPTQLILSAVKYVPEVKIVSVDSSQDEELGLVNVQFVYSR